MADRLLLVFRSHRDYFATSASCTCCTHSLFFGVAWWWLTSLWKEKWGFLSRSWLWVVMVSLWDLVQTCWNSRAISKQSSSQVAAYKIVLVLGIILLWPHHMSQILVGKRDALLIREMELQCGLLESVTAPHQRNHSSWRRKEHFRTCITGEGAWHLYLWSRIRKWPKSSITILGLQNCNYSIVTIFKLDKS